VFHISQLHHTSLLSSHHLILDLLSTCLKVSLSLSLSLSLSHGRNSRISEQLVSYAMLITFGEVRQIKPAQLAFRHTGNVYLLTDLQELLDNVDTMIRTIEQQQQQPVQQQTDGSTSSRTELLQRELGRLNSRLCCTVLALERAMSKALCRGAQSGVVTTRLVTSDQVDANGVHLSVMNTKWHAYKLYKPSIGLTSECISSRSE